MLTVMPQLRPYQADMLRAQEKHMRIVRRAHYIARIGRLSRYRRTPELREQLFAVHHSIMEKVRVK